MTIGDAVALALLGLSILTVLLSCLGAWRAATPLDGQHFVSAAGTVPPVLLAAAVVVREGWTTGSVLAVLTAAVLVVTGAAITAGFARAVAGPDDGTGSGSTAGPEQSERSDGGQS